MGNLAINQRHYRIPKLTGLKKLIIAKEWGLLASNGILRPQKI